MIKINNKEEFDDAIAFYLDLMREARKIREMIKETYKMSYDSVLSLLVIAHREGITQDELAYELNYSKAKVVRIVDELENLKIVSRFKNEKDRRQNHIKITDKAQEIILDMIKLNNQLTDSLLKREEKTICKAVNEFHNEK